MLLATRGSAWGGRSCRSRGPSAPRAKGRLGLSDSLRSDRLGRPSTASHVTRVHNRCLGPAASTHCCLDVARRSCARSLVHYADVEDDQIVRWSQLVAIAAGERISRRCRRASGRPQRPRGSPRSCTCQGPRMLKYEVADFRLARLAASSIHRGRCAMAVQRHVGASVGDGDVCDGLVVGIDELMVQSFCAFLRGGVGVARTRRARSSPLSEVTMRPVANSGMVSGQRPRCSPRLLLRGQHGHRPRRARAEPRHRRMRST